MTAMVRNMFLMCFSVFVLNTAILAHADAGYLADNISHEVFGHGLIYIHTHSRTASGHLTNPKGGLIDYNQLLIDLIYKSQKESINNFKGL